MDKEIRIPILLDLYGNLLSETQRYYLDSYYNNDLSLSEISDNVGKSRQGICESIKRAELILIDTEEKLGFLKKTESLKKDLSCIEKMIDKLKNNLKTTQATCFEKDFREIFKTLRKYKDE